MKRMNSITLVLGLMTGGYAPHGLADEYSLIVENQSTNSASISVYQTYPSAGIFEGQPLAWLSKYSHPGTNVAFKWKDEYNFVWGESYVLGDVALQVSQVIPAATEVGQTIRLSYDKRHDAYYFQPSRATLQAGSLIIEQGGDIPLKQAFVGIGMAGKATFTVPAQPNITLNFKPQPKYWLTFGRYTEGKAIDMSLVTNQVEVKFPENVQVMKATLNKDNSWTVKPG